MVFRAFTHIKHGLYHSSGGESGGPHFPGFFLTNRLASGIVQSP